MSERDLEDRTERGQKPCLSFEWNGDQTTIVKGHSKKKTELLLDIRRLAMRSDQPYQTHHCQNCGCIDAITVGKYP